MTVLFVDSFDHYAAADITKKWTSSSGSITGFLTGRTGLALKASSSFSAQKSVANSATLVMGFALNTPTLSGTFRFADGSSSQTQIVINADGSITAWRFTNQSLGSSAAGVITINNWYYIEFKTTFSNTGSFEVRVNGVNVLSGSSVDTTSTANNYANSLHIAPATSAFIDDLYLCDALGSTNNTFLGDVRVDALLPNGAGSNTDWTPSTGSNYTCVDETSISTTDYVSSSTVGHIDTYAFANLTSITGTILAVAVNNVVSKDDAGAKSIADVVKSSSTTSVGSNFTPSFGSWLVCQQIWETDPNTSAAWTESGVNAAEFGCKVTA
jgi:hypothetical protein